jgi:hypothetical protein
MSDPKWKDEYSQMSVSPHELYLRQSGECRLEAVIADSGEVTVYCTDGKEKAETSCMLNPTLECAQCLVKNLVKAIKNGIDIDE